MNNKKLIGKLPFFCILIFCVSVFSCTTGISGTLKEGGSGDFRMNTNLQPRTSNLIRTFQMMSGSGGGNLILDGAEISRSMSQAPGIGSVSLSNNGPSALSGNITINKIGDFLAVADRETKFVTFRESSSGQGSIVINLSLDNASEVISLLSEDAVIYLSALMAPAVTGEALNKTNYLALVASLYGQPIADEISAAKINASIDFPGRITSIRGGTSSGIRAVFEVPLLDLLVLDAPLIWEVTWQK